MLTSASNQSRRIPVQRATVVLAQQRNCSGTFQRIWNLILRLDICSCGQRMPSWSLELVPGPSEAEQLRQLQIKRPPVDMSSQGAGTGLEVVGAAVDQAGRKSKQKNKGGAAGGDSTTYSVVGLLRQASAGQTGSHPVCHERDDGSVVAPFRPQTSNPASSSWAAPTSRGNHDKADERPERARLALVRARWEAQGGGGPTRRESTSTRQVAPTRSQTTEPSILLLLEGRTPAVPSRRGTPRRL